jgi:hypothetical protein
MVTLSTGRNCGLMGLVSLCLGIALVAACSPASSVSSGTQSPSKEVTSTFPTNTPETLEIIPTPTSARVPNLGNAVGGGEVPATAQAPISGSVLSVVEFNLSSSNHTPPSDVLKEVGFYEGGGGGDGLACDSLGHEPVAFWPQSLEIMEDASILSCNWQPNELISVTLAYPNGIIRENTVRANLFPYTKIYAVRIKITLQVTDPLGRYSFLIAGKTKSLKGTFEVVEPIGPRIKLTDAGTILYGFSPGERIRYFAYQQEEATPPYQKCTLAGWQQFTIGPKGHLVVQSSYYPIAIGEISGEVHLSVGGYGCNNILIYNTKPCPNAPVSHLSSGDRAGVTYSNGINVRVRSGAGTKYDKVASLPEGALMSIVDGPICADDYVWWKVKVDKGPTGWVAEGEPGNYFIEPKR